MKCYTPKFPRLQKLFKERSLDAQFYDDELVLNSNFFQAERTKPRVQPVHSPGPSGFYSQPEIVTYGPTLVNCNRGNNCPWSEESQGDDWRSVCQKCGLRAQGSGQ